MSHIKRFEGNSLNTYFSDITKMTDVFMEFLLELLMWVRILTIEMHYHKMNLILGGKE